VAHEIDLLAKRTSHDRRDDDLRWSDAETPKTVKTASMLAFVVGACGCGEKSGKPEETRVE
jgi:hypothetical protein